MLGLRPSPGNATAVGLDLSDGLVAELRAWARSIDDTLDLDVRDRLNVRDRVDGKYDGEWERLCRAGSAPAQRLANELGPSRAVT
ncbi:hypothetical protein ACWDAG_43845 [Streptomyces sp. NPDC001157]